MRLSCDKKKLESFSENQMRFYLKYSKFVFKVLSKPSFQRYICWILRKESIDTQTIKTVDVSVLPLRGENGKTLAGKCNPTYGKIRIYPKTANFCKNLKRKFGRTILLHYAGNRARAALIHELLHLKYKEKEQIVRELCENYFRLFRRKQVGRTSSAKAICMMIFKTKTAGIKGMPKEKCAQVTRKAPIEGKNPIANNSRASMPFKR
jgi:hypothetical protein